MNSFMKSRYLQENNNFPPLAQIRKSLSHEVFDELHQENMKDPGIIV